MYKNILLLFSDKIKPKVYNQLKKIIVFLNQKEYIKFPINKGLIGSSLYDEYSETIL